MKVDYILVGMGVAGLSICESLRKRNLSFVVYDSQIRNATRASGGVINPTILKRFNTPWNTGQFYPYALAFYKELEQYLEIDGVHNVPIDRIFVSVEEQNNWIVASDKVKMKAYLDPNLVSNFNTQLIAPLGLGEVKGTLRLDIRLILDTYKQKLRLSEGMKEEVFDYNLLDVEKDGVSYSGISAQRIIFADGPSAMENPFFPKDVLIPNKGEYIVVHAPKLKLKRMIKGNHYIIPLGNDRYKVGATFEGSSTSWNPSKGIKEFLESELRRMIRCPFTTEEEIVGIRATTQDHKPVLGSLKSYKNIVFLNGLGTRGLMMAPFVGNLLVESLEDGKEIPADMHINRYV